MKCARQKGKTESNEQSKEGRRPNKFMEKGGMPDRVKAFEKSIVERIVRKPGLGLLNSSEMD